MLFRSANDTINAANKQAQEILDSATQDANSIRLSAITYTDDMMANIGSVLNQTLEDAGGKYKGFIDALQSCLDVVNHNRQELAPQTAQAAAFLFSALASSLVAAFNSAFLAFSCVFRSSRFAVSVATSDSIFSFSAVFSATTAA